MVLLGILCFCRLDILNLFKIHFYVLTWKLISSINPFQQCIYCLLQLYLLKYLTILSVSTTYLLHKTLHKFLNWSLINSGYVHTSIGSVNQFVTLTAYLSTFRASLTLMSCISRKRSLGSSTGWRTMRLRLNMNRSIIHQEWNWILHYARKGIGRRSIRYNSLVLPITDIQIINR